MSALGSLVLTGFLVFVLSIGCVARIVEEDQEAYYELKWMLGAYKE